MDDQDLPEEVHDRRAESVVLEVPRRHNNVTILVLLLAVICMCVASIAVNTKTTNDNADNFQAAVEGMSETLAAVNETLARIDVAIATMQENQAITQCRSQVTTASSAAQTAWNLAFADLLLAVAAEAVGGEATPPEQLAALAADVIERGEALKVALAARFAFDLDPTGDCGPPTAALPT